MRPKMRRSQEGRGGDFIKQSITHRLFPIIWMQVLYLRSIQACACSGMRARGYFLVDGPQASVGFYLPFCLFLSFFLILGLHGSTHRVGSGTLWHPILHGSHSTHCYHLIWLPSTALTTLLPLAFLAFSFSEHSILVQHTLKSVDQTSNYRLLLLCFSFFDFNFLLSSFKNIKNQWKDNYDFFLICEKKNKGLLLGVGISLSAFFSTRLLCVP